ncbi:MAG: hypothetical protein SGJ18_07960 [Pseudomonadota bacterium]|nr:hypothetical protein [Pseudomonadota bacterium]
MISFEKLKLKPDLRQKERGQIVVEYVMILFVAVVLAVYLVSTLVSRSPTTPGILITKWQAILVEIGKDLADSP